MRMCVCGVCLCAWCDQEGMRGEAESGCLSEWDRGEAKVDKSEEGGKKGKK